jgi:chlorophyllide a reductase subunit X
LASNVATAPPVLPNPLIQDDLLNLFSSDVVGRDYKLEPAELSDLTGVNFEDKKSLEVIYDAA